MEPKTLPATLILLSILFLSACSGTGQNNTTQTRVELYVLAAASLSDALKEIQPIYEASHLNVKLLTSFGASGALQQQIEQGAPADLFISAASKQMKNLIDKNLIDSAHQTNLLKNELVLIVPKQTGVNIQSFQELQNPDVKKIAIGQPETVPAGTYAYQTLSNFGIWDTIQPYVVFAKDVRQVLTYVETGNVDAGIVFKTDAVSTDKIKVVATADTQSHDPIVYQMGTTKAVKNASEAQELYNWLQGPDAQKVFEKYGFLSGNE